MQRRLPDVPLLSEQDAAYCRALLSNGSKTFFAASFLLPRRIRDAATALYSFCRVADDAIDRTDDVDAALESLRLRLDRVYDGYPAPLPEDRALAAVTYHAQIPRALLDALIEGFEWDAAGRRYETLRDLQDYAARVAGSVGVMMALLMGVRSAEQLARASDLGIAMQLTNIARDVGEDARAGRLYLPERWLRDEGIDPDAWVAAPEFNSTIEGIIERLLQAAREFYERADSGIARLPQDCQRGIYAARLLYAEIGEELARRGSNSVAARAVVPMPRKLALLAQAMVRPVADTGAIGEAAVEASQFLVQAAARVGLRSQADLSQLSRREPQWWNVYGKLVRLIELIEAIERRERADLSVRTGA